MADIKKIEDELWEAGTMGLMPHVGNNFLYTKCLPCTPRFFGKTSPELFATRFCKVKFHTQQEFTFASGQIALPVRRAIACRPKLMPREIEV